MHSIYDLYVFRLSLSINLILIILIDTRISLHLLTISITYQFSLLLFVCLACPWLAALTYPSPTPPYCTVVGLSTFLSFGLIGFRRVVPGWPARSGSVKLGTVNKVSAVRLREAKGRLSYKRGGKEKGKARVRTEERGRGEDPSTFSFIFIINLFKLFSLV